MYFFSLEKECDVEVMQVTRNEHELYFFLQISTNINRDTFFFILTAYAHGWEYAAQLELRAWA